MTTTANKQGLRAAGNARTNKAAQRTALPPRAGAVAEAVAAICTCGGNEAEDGKILIHSHTCPLKPKAPRAPRKTAAQKAAEAEALTAAHEARIAAGQEKARAKRAAEDAAEAAQVAPTETEAPTAPSGPTKADKHVAGFETHGWTVTLQQDGPWVELIARRGSETIHQGWLDGVYDHDRSGTYVIGDRSVKTRNLAEARRFAARDSKAAAAEFAKVVTNKAFRKREVAAPAVKGLPFDPELSRDEDILSALEGGKVTWHNRIARSEETAVVPKGGRFTVMSVTPETDEVPAERVVLFCCPNSGFRAFRVADIRKIGRVRVSN